MHRGLRTAHRTVLGHCRRHATAAAPVKEPAVGQTYTTTKQFEPEEIATFLDICGDDNPIHFDFELAQAAGFQGILLPGLLCASLFPGLIGTAFPGAVYVSQELRFRRPALASEPVHAVVEISAVTRRKLSFATHCLTADGAVLVEGSAVALLRTLQTEQGSAGQA